MTAVASPPSFANINRPAWSNGGQSLNTSINHDDVRGMFAPRKTIQRTNSSSSIASNSSASSTSSTSTLVSVNGSTGGGSGGAATPISEQNGFPITTLRKRPLQRTTQWSGNKLADGQSEFVRGVGGRQGIGAGPNGVSSLHQLPPFIPGQTPPNGTNGIMARAAGEALPAQGQPVLYLLSLNGTFDRKTITVPFSPETLRIGRQTNKSTTPTTANGYFDSKVLSRQHAEIWAERNGKIWIRDIKSSNGTFVNGARLSAENRESEPHELQTNDHLELGIDIVSEDQKSVVHHKVAAKVEHAGFLNASNNLLEMNFGDLDPANGALMGGSQMNGMMFRGRTGSQASVGAANRMAPAPNMGAQTNGMALQRGLWFTGPSTEAIVKKIHQEMRNAKLQSQDLLRTQEFLKTLLSKDDIRNDAKAEETNGVAHAPAAASAAAPARSAPHMVNGNGIAFRADPKARFSDPPAPPPQQPLPEKPDVPSLKRGSTERPKSGSTSNSSPIRPDVVGQVLQLTDALNSAKREIDTQHLRVRELEDKLHKEQEARRSAEELARRLEEAASTAAAAASTQYMNGSAKGLAGQVAALEEAFEPPSSKAPSAANGLGVSRDAPLGTSDDVSKARMDAMILELEGLRQQMEEFRKRAEKAEAERDADRVTLAEMVKRIRQRDEDEAKAAATAAAAAAAAAAASAATKTTSAEPAEAHKEQTLSKSFSRGSKRGNIGSLIFSDAAMDGAVDASPGNAGSGTSSPSMLTTSSLAQLRSPMDAADEVAEDQLMLSRTNTITPATSSLTKVSPNQALVQTIPYASMVGVVLLGMGLMAYLNGWQQHPPRLDR